MNSRPTLDSLRQPEHTGDNRCIPCTSVNITIALCLGVVTAYIWIPAGIALFIASLIIIYLRGYLIPGTPTLTKRYLPEPILKLFEQTSSKPNHSGLEQPSRPTPAKEQTTDPETILLEANAIEPCQNKDDLCLTDEFQATWDEHLDTTSFDSLLTESENEGDAKSKEQIHNSEQTPFDQLVETDEEIHVESQKPDDDIFAYTDTAQVGYWRSHSAFLADITAAAALSEQYDGWSDLMVEERFQAINGLRAFLEECPECGGEIEMGEDVVESCCRAHDVLVLSCIDCETRLLEIDNPQVK